MLQKFKDNFKYHDLIEGHHLFSLELKDREGNIEVYYEFDTLIPAILVKNIFDEKHKMIELSNVGKVREFDMLNAIYYFYHYNYDIISAADGEYVYFTMQKGENVEYKWPDKDSIKENYKYLGNYDSNQFNLYDKDLKCLAAFMIHISEKHIYQEKPCDLVTAIESKLSFNGVYKTIEELSDYEVFHIELKTVFNGPFGLPYGMISMKEKGE